MNNLAKTVRIMAKTSLFHDTRKVESGSEAPIRFRIYHKGKYVHVPSGIKVTADQWANNTIVNHPRAKQWNTLLSLRLADLTSEILQMEVSGTLNKLSPEQLKDKLMLCIGHQASTTTNFVDVYKEKMSLFDKPGTIGIWNNTLI